jgi:hypothetical protein
MTVLEASFRSHCVLGAVHIYPSGLDLRLNGGGAAAISSPYAGGVKSVHQRGSTLPEAAGGDGGHGAARPEGVIHRNIFYLVAL